ncbi:calcium-binding protein, partial [Mesorhizobium sp. IRAMC:0171]|nr:calcium-binding protein [Mesorhizobium sp. IRAMC:0171]
GSGSVTAAAVGTAGATIGGNAYTFAGTTPTSTVSVGALGTERTITNVAAGRLSNASTDAVNGSQLFATNQQVDLNTTDIANISGNVTNLGNTVTNLGNTINNIAGDTSTTYTDANGDGIRYVRTNDRTLAVSDSSAQGIGSTAVGYNATAVADSSLALGRASQATIEGAVALGSGSISNRALAPATGTINAGPTGLIQFNTTDKTLLGAVSVGTDTAYRQIVNVADGTAASDAVTLRQLQGAIASVSVTPTMYFHANSTAVDSLAVGAESIAVGPTTVVNGDNGIGIGNGAVVDQTAPGGTAIGQAARVAAADGVALGTQANAGGVQTVALGAGAQSTHTNSVALGAQSITTVGAQAGYTGFALTAPQTSFGEVSIGSAGKERKLTNVAAGSAETDGVNVSQLRGLGTQVTNLIGGGTVVNPDGTITGPTYNVQGNSYTTVYDGITAIDNAITNINNGGGIKYFHANSTLADSIASGTDSVAMGPQSVASGTNSVAAGNGAVATGNGSMALGQGAQANNANDVALGSGSTTQAAVGTAGATIKGTYYNFAGTAPVGTVSVGDAGAERTITNVAAGRIGADSTDAINGSQLHATNQAIASLQTGVGSITQNAVQYDLNPDGSKKNSITLQGGDINAPVVISNVGAGVANNDAVNVGQLKQTVTEAKTFAVQTANNYTDTVATRTLGQANDYTDQKFNQLNQEMGGIRDEARQAAAIGLAAASLRYDDRPGKLSVA